MAEIVPTPEMLAMARRIVFESCCSGQPWQRAELMSGRFDNNDAMKAALATIKETTERVAKLVESLSGGTRAATAFHGALVVQVKEMTE